MRFQSSMAAAACVFAAGLTVAGCSSGASTSSASLGATSVGSPAAQATTPAANPASSPAAAPAGSPASTPASSQQGQTLSNCQPANLSFSLIPANGAAGSQLTATVQMTNKGSAACEMDGFPGVNLVGAASGKSDYTWDLMRDNSTPQQVTVQPGASAYFKVTYLSWSSADSAPIKVDKMVITPPNDYTQAELPWSVSVVLQDSATRPGTYIGPVTATN